MVGLRLCKVNGHEIKIALGYFANIRSLNKYMRELLLAYVLFRPLRKWSGTKNRWLFFWALILALFAEWRHRLLNRVTNYCKGVFCTCQTLVRNVPRDFWTFPQRNIIVGCHCYRNGQILGGNNSFVHLIIVVDSYDLTRKIFPVLMRIAISASSSNMTTALITKKYRNRIAIENINILCKIACWSERVKGQKNRSSVSR